jgi:cellulose synthase/poly-beta-1,6-N-acetylglucosamine synthase-like glycosyltransferase
MTGVVLFTLSLAAVAYILVGYPLLLGWWPWRQAPAVRKDASYKPRVSVILAVHNGEAFLREKLESLLALEYPKESLEILVLSDGSTDATAAIAREYAARGVRLIELLRGGKPSAVNRGIAEATGEILFFTDVRQPLEPDALTHLAANFADPTVGAVTGELQYRQKGSGEQADLNLYWRYELWARNRHSSIDSLFNTTGCIYAMRRELAAPIPADTLVDDAAIPLRAFFKGYRIIFEPLAIAYDLPTVAGGEFRRRLRTLAGLWQVHVRHPAFLIPGSRMWVHFVSHKTGRLILPWAVLGLGLGTWLFPMGWFRTLLLVGEAAALLMALADGWFRRGNPLKRLTSPARTFLVMNAAALCAVAVFFVPPQTLWGTTKVEGQSSAIRR